MSFVEEISRRCQQGKVSSWIRHAEPCVSALRLPHANRAVPSIFDRQYKFILYSCSPVLDVLARIAVHIPRAAYKFTLTMNWNSMNSTLVDLNELSTMLGRSPETIKKDLKRNRLAVPPRLHIPGTRLLRWRQIDIDRWLASHVEVQVEVGK